MERGMIIKRASSKNLAVRTGEPKWRSRFSVSNNE
jgi:hypothetical protein